MNIFIHHNETQELICQLTNINEVSIKEIKKPKLKRFVYTNAVVDSLAYFFDKQPTRYKYVIVKNSCNTPTKIGVYHDKIKAKRVSNMIKECLLENSHIKHKFLVLN